MSNESGRIEMKYFLWPHIWKHETKYLRDFDRIFSFIGIRFSYETLLECQMRGFGEVKSSARRNHFKRQRSLIVKHKRSRILMIEHDDYGLLCKKSGGSTLTCSTIENCTKAWRLIELMLTPLSRCIFETLVLSYRHRECYVALTTWVCGHLSPFYPQHSSSTIEWVFK